MAYQKLQTSRAWKINPSDDTNIPQIMVKDSTGTVAAFTATSITDTGVDFFSLGVRVGMIVVNDTTGTQAIVTGVNQSADQDILTISGGAFAIGNSYTIYGGDNNGCVLYVGNGGNVRVTTAGGDDVVFVGLPSGGFVPVQVVKVWETSTDATDIIALW